MSVFIWVMMGIAVWHFAVLVPDRFWGAIIGPSWQRLPVQSLRATCCPSPGSRPATHRA